MTKNQFSLGDPDDFSYFYIELHLVMSSRRLTAHQVLTSACWASTSIQVLDSRYLSTTFKAMPTQLLQK